MLQEVYNKKRERNGPTATNDGLTETKNNDDDGDDDYDTVGGRSTLLNHICPLEFFFLVFFSKIEFFTQLSRSLIENNVSCPVILTTVLYRYKTQKKTLKNITTKKK